MEELDKTKSNARYLSQVNQSSLRRKIWPVLLVLAGVIAAILIAAYYFYFAAREKMVLTIAAGPYLSDSFTLMQEVAEVVERNSENLRVEVSATADSSVNISQLNQRIYDLATIRSSTPVVSDVQMVAELFPDFFQLITDPKSGITSYNNLEGRTIAIPPYGSEGNRFFFIMMDHFDVDLSKFNWLAVSFEKSMELMFQGKVDGFFTVRSLRDRRLLRFFEEAQLKNFDVSYVPVDQAAAISLKRPFLEVAEIPKGAYVGSKPTPEELVSTASVKRILVTRSDVEPAAIRELTRIMFENRFDLTIRFALANAVSQPEISGGLTIPIHEGALAYYERNEPSFLQENAEPIALIITICAMIGSAILALRGRFNASQKNRLDSYNYRLLAIAETARNSDRIDQIRDLKSELFGVLETVVRALDTDEVTEEGFQSFSLLWESVREVLNDRIHELRSS